MTGFVAGTCGLRYDVPRDIEELQEAFIRCHALERRAPGGGRWPFAGDGPWHLAQGEVGDIAGDYSTTLLENEAGKLLEVRKLTTREPRSGLDSSEVDELERLRSWLRMVPLCKEPLALDHNRKLVWLATEQLHKGEGRVRWKAIGHRINSPRTPDALALRYRRAMAEVVRKLNGWSKLQAKRMAA